MTRFESEEEGFVLVESTPSPSLDAISQVIDNIGDEFWPVNKKIHDNPELGYKEFIAHDVLTKFMRSRDGWHVTPSAYGMKTAWVASFDSGEPGPVVSFNAEMDCLPNIGHACGHNLIATASVLGAVATAEMMKGHGVPGKVVLFGTPAEEGGGGKIKLLQAGAYRDHNVDISLISHPGIVPDAAIMPTAAYVRFKVEYFGREAHAAANPWLGINALDALITAYNAISVLRQQTQPGDIIQGHITNGGLTPNIIHAYSSGVFVVRADTQHRLDELRKKVDACFKAGALATGSKLIISPEGAYKNHIPNRPLGRVYTNYWNTMDPPFEIPTNQDVDEQRGKTQASTDQGDISHAMPSLSVGFHVKPGPLGQGPHNPEFAEAAGTRDAYSKALRVAKALAATAVDVCCVEGLLDAVHEYWKDSVKGDI